MANLQNQNAGGSLVNTARSTFGDGGRTPARRHKMKRELRPTMARGGRTRPAMAQGRRTRPTMARGGRTRPAMGAGGLTLGASKAKASARRKSSRPISSLRDRHPVQSMKFQQKSVGVDDATRRAVK